MTQHAKHRLKERFGIDDGDQFLRDVREAICEGLAYLDITASRKHANQGARKARVFVRGLDLLVVYSRNPASDHDITIITIMAGRLGAIRTKAKHTPAQRKAAREARCAARIAREYEREEGGV